MLFTLHTQREMQKGLKVSPFSPHLGILQVAWNLALWVAFLGLYETFN